MTLSTHSIQKAAALVGVVALLGCDAILDVRNPDEVPVTELQQELLVKALVNGAVTEFTHMYDDPFIWRGSMFTDEQVTGVNWEQTARLNLRIVQYNEGDADLMFSDISRALRLAEDAYARFQTLEARPDSSANAALVAAFAGYSYTAMGEAMCEAVVSKINIDTPDLEPEYGDRLLSPDSLFLRAINWFNQAITIATTVNDANILNLSRVGLARAALNAGQPATAITAATPVAAAFKYWLDFNAVTGRETNNQFTNISGANHRLGMHPRFLQAGGAPFGTQRLVSTQTDPRIQHDTVWTRGHNALTKLYKIRQGLRFDGYNGWTWSQKGATGWSAPRAYERGTDILLADGVEAQHHLYEATGPTAATATFVNARRTVGRQSTITFNLPADNAALMAELREQRARDLFQGGFRLGDLRRWLKQGINDPNHSFPTGPHVNSPRWQSYSNATCYPLPLEEYEGNPNIRELKPGG